jgi:hypothetical protein
MYVGGLAGVNFAVMEIQTNEVKNVDVNTVFGFGAIVGIPLFINTHVQLKPKYLQKGGLIELSENGIDIEFKSGPNILNLTIEEEDKTFNRGFKLMLGYTIPLGF